MSRFSNLGYTPLDIPGIEFDNHLLESTMSKIGISHHPYGDIWQAITVLGRASDFQDPISCYSAWKARYDTQGKVFVNHNIVSDLLVPILHLINQLPYDVCTFAQILSQKTDVPPHQDVVYESSVDAHDGVYTDNTVGEPEPAGLKILLSQKSVRSFYLMKDAKSKRDFIRVPEDTNCFAINERTFFHGAKHPKQFKFIISTFGIIDRVKHSNLITKSVEKYKDYTIWY